MREGKGEGLRAVLAALGAGALFSGFWLGLGLPLPWSLAAGGAAYGALWLMLRKPAGPEEEGSIGDFVDRDLAARVAASARASAAALGSTIAEGGPSLPAVQRFRRLVELLNAIAADVEADPKDAEAAQAFLAVNAESAARLARLALELERRGASAEQRAETRERLEKTLARLEAAFQGQLARLQEDNLAELEAELEVLESSLDWEAPSGAGDGAREARPSFEAAERPGTDKPAGGGQGKRGVAGHG